MKLGYADPPYIGCAHLYRDHPDYAGEVDHPSLIERLEAEFDGFFFVADAGGEGLARPFGNGKGICRGTGASPAEHGDAGLRARICFEPNPRTLVPIDGLPRPVGYVRAFGNAIVPQVAAEFIRAATG